MPAKNSIKVYVENGYYHIYNRGVEKRTIFEDDQDYKVFMKYLKEYLSPPPKVEDIIKTFTLKGGSFKGIPYQNKNYTNKLDLIAYCLMPNHFHLVIRQIKSGAMEGFMRSLATRYSMYFNKRYDRVGKLFQGHYKACLIEAENYLLHLTRYVHLNPQERYSNLTQAYSSYAEYLEIRKTSWIKPAVVLSFFNQAKSNFNKVNTYRNFIEEYVNDAETSFIVESIKLEE